MKCNNCQTAIPPSFTKALQDNACPACGKAIMSSALNAEFSSIKEKLADADVDEQTLVKVAAIIAGKYDLVPRGRGQVQTTQLSNRATAKTRMQLQDEEIERELMLEYPQLQNMPENERKQEILLLRAEAEREFGLSKGDVAAAKAAKGSADITQLNDIVQNLLPPELPSGLDLDSNATDAMTAQRMAKLAALRENPNVNRFRRSDG
jgi:hypothetical protein